jgi:hypothetical protein
LAIPQTAKCRQIQVFSTSLQHPFDASSKRVEWPYPKPALTSSLTSCGMLKPKRKSRRILHRPPAVRCL